MTDQASIAAFRFGFGLPLPDRVSETPEALLAQLSGPDWAAGKWKGYGVNEVLPVLMAVREARGMEAEGADAKKAAKARRRAIKAGNALAALGARVTFAPAFPSPRKSGQPCLAGSPNR